MRLLGQMGCSGMEIAPSRIWPEPVNTTVSERKDYRKMVSDHGLEISAMQALLYTRQDLGLFRTASVEWETVEYIKKLCALAHDLGLKVLVFGSPANRKRGEIAMGEALERAAAFFAKIAPVAEGFGLCVCIEPLRPQETDFITSSAEGLKLVDMVGSPGFGLHLDAKALSEEGSDIKALLSKAVGSLRHFHINDPDLVDVNSTGKVDHFAIGGALRECGYDRFVSIEMRQQADHDRSIRSSLKVSRQAYIAS